MTYDPRGVRRSPRADGVTGATRDEHAKDLHRLISELDAGPVDIFASSGGAVNALLTCSETSPSARGTLASKSPSNPGWLALPVQSAFRVDS